MIPDPGTREDPPFARRWKPNSTERPDTLSSRTRPRASAPNPTMSSRTQPRASAPNPIMSSRTRPRASARGSGGICPSGGSTFVEADPFPRMRSGQAVTSFLPMNMKRSPTLVDLAVAAESWYQQALTDAAGPGLGGDPGFGFGVRAAGGGTGIGSTTTPALLPVPRFPPPASRRPSSGNGRPAAGSGTGIGGEHAAVGGAWAGVRAGS